MVVDEEWSDVSEVNEEGENDVVEDHVWEAMATVQEKLGDKRRKK